MKNILTVALVVFVASIALSQNSEPPKKTLRERLESSPPFPVPVKDLAQVLEAKQPQRWEYKIEKRGGHIEQPEIWEKTLNDMAKEGWELDQINQDKFYILRRPARGAAPL